MTDADTIRKTARKTEALMSDVLALLHLAALAVVVGIIGLGIRLAHALEGDTDD